MSLEQFKTQVLLLHSEQSTLDSLSRGFSDRYTVHCATSGSEALNTLGDTQIDVIVTAQRLPGMSGLDALREAKKRSPDMIGILLAGSADDGLEALVGDKEVFQIIRGNVTADSLGSLIDNATRQTRLLALADSANDTAANVDEPVSEHIVMETSENGSTIISDGTGTLPTLNPAKISAATNVGSRAIDVLVVTKDQEFLQTVRESARGMHNVLYANTLAQADEAVRNNQIGVAVVDAAMLGDNVEKMTLHLRATAPRLVSIVAGRRDDGEMLMDLINRGKVYRFLLKPVSPGRARLAIEASVKHHLEAPDAAFKTLDQASAPVPQPKPIAKTQAKPQSEAKPKAVAASKQQPAAQKPAAQKPRVVPTIKVEPRLGPGSDSGDMPSPIDDSLSDPFGYDKSFTETVTGLVTSLGEKFKATKSSSKAQTPAETSPPPVETSPTPVETSPTPMEISPTPMEISSSAGSPFTDPRNLGIGAAALVVVTALGWWMFSGSDEAEIVDAPVPGIAADVPVDTPAVSNAEPVINTPAPTPAPVEPQVNVDELLAEARLAAAAGQIFNPPGSNAIELYSSAAAIAPDNMTAVSELANTIDQALGMAESSLLERRVDDAAAALRQVGLVDPDNSRLPFLNAQLGQIQLRNFLDDARVAIRESRFEDASAALDGARALRVVDTTEIDTVADELSRTLSDQRVDDVLAKANTRLDEGKLTSPSNDNARYYFELALSNNPQSTEARQGLSVVASKLVFQAREQIDAGDFSAADILLADARRLDPSSSDVAATTEALSVARNRQEQDRLNTLQREADAIATAQRAQEEREAAAAQAEADRLAAEKLATEKQAAEKQAAADALAARQSAVTDTVVNDTPTPEISKTANSMMPVSISSLNRIKYVAPKYPRGAQRRNLSGWVDVIFTIGVDGTVKDAEARESTPGDIFVSSAITAVERWEFEPIVESGIAVEKRSAVRMMFAIE